MSNKALRMPANKSISCYRGHRVSATYSVRVQYYFLARACLLVCVRVCVCTCSSAASSMPLQTTMLPASVYHKHSDCLTKTHCRFSMAQNCDAAVGLGHGPAIQSFSQPVALTLWHTVWLLFVYLLQLAYCFMIVILNFSVIVVPQCRKEALKEV